MAEAPPFACTIRTALNGWIVEIGCQTVLFTTMESLTKAIELYLSDPQGTARWYAKNAVNAKFYNIMVPVPEARTDRDHTAARQSPALFEDAARWMQRGMEAEQAERPRREAIDEVARAGGVLVGEPGV